MKKRICLALCLALCLCGCQIGEGRRIIRVSHNQSETHPTHLGLLEFERYVEERLGEKYDVQIYPNELLGPQVRTVELCQTGAIDFTVASISILESFGKMYQIFNLPYLFQNEEHYYRVMEDENLLRPIYESTKNSGFEAITWYDAGSRNFYNTKRPVNTPEDLKGMKIRVQQGATNVKMMKMFGASASPMNFGDVYAALQQNVIDGAENNELALTQNKHGEVAKYYSYDQHQMVPDILIANVAFLSSLPQEEQQIFLEAAEQSTAVQREEWRKAVDQARQQAQSMGVMFTYPQKEPFRQKVLPLHDEILIQVPQLKSIYDAIEEMGKEEIDYAEGTR